MLHDLDKTFENILIAEGKLNPNEIDISFEQPTREWSSRLSRPTLDCWCFDLRENLKLRNMEMRVAPNGNRGRTNLPPRRFDLTYLATAWARKIEDEHQLLWRALGTLKRYTALDPEQCEGALRYQTHEIPLLVGDMSNNPVNLVDLWSVLDNEMRLGFIMTATVELDTEMGFEGPLVLEATIRVGQSEDPTEWELSHPSSELKIKPKSRDRSGEQEGKEGRR